jgi:hypothetical protein
LLLLPAADFQRFEVLQGHSIQVPFMFLCAGSLARPTALPWPAKNSSPVLC